ncbi:MAG: hypothetical protein ACK45B_09430 [Limisphaerales bacterium]
MKTKRLAKIFGLGLLAVVGAAVGLWWWARPGAPTFPPLPNPNGYDDFVEAGHGVLGNPVLTPNDDPDLFSGMVLANEGALRQIRSGLAKESRVPAERFYAADLADLGDLRALKRAAFLLRAEALLTACAGRTNDAARIHLDGSAIRSGSFARWLHLSPSCRSRL